MREVVIASACRTPIGKFQGSLSPFRAPELGGPHGPTRSFIGSTDCANSPETLASGDPKSLLTTVLPKLYRRTVDG